MKHLGKVLWMIPLAVHVGYFLATFEHYPSYIGAGVGELGTEFYLFVTEWFAIIGLANVALLGVHIKLPTMKDRWLSVPGKDFWISTEARKEELIDKLRGFCEAALLLLNVFFLAIYQSVYQSNAPSPVVKLGDPILVGGFVVVPIVLLLAAFAATLRSLASKARHFHDEAAVDEEAVDEAPPTR